MVPVHDNYKFFSHVDLLPERVVSGRLGSMKPVLDRMVRGQPNCSVPAGFQGQGSENERTHSRGVVPDSGHSGTIGVCPTTTRDRPKVKSRV